MGGSSLSRYNPRHGSGHRRERRSTRGKDRPCAGRWTFQAPLSALRADFSVSQGVAAAARGGQVGELFQYAIDKPVNLPRQQSAMLPILNQQVNGERFSLFNEGNDPTNPLNAVKLKNSRTLHLMQGPSWSSTRGRTRETRRSLLGLFQITSDTIRST